MRTLTSRNRMPAAGTVGRFAAAAVLTLAAAACSDEPVSPEDDELDALRAAVLPLQDVDEAHTRGYEVLVTHPTSGDRCLADPDRGGMGFHFLDPALADGVVAIDSPEVLIYEPQDDGSLDFVAVEYIVPFAIRGEDETPPVLFGREFKQNHTFNLWALHVWAWEDNPSGTFADYNPNVSCAHAAAVP